MADTVLDKLNKDVLGPRNRNIDSSVAVAISESAFGAEAIAEHVDGKHVGRLREVVRDTTKPRHPDTALNEDQHELLTDVKALFDEVASRGGVQLATMLNMHPWPIASTGPHLAGITIPACPIEDEYKRFVLDSWRRDFGDRGGKFKVSPVWPIQLLRDVERQHQNWGGLVVYLGDRIPGQAKNKIETAYDKIFSVLKKLTDKESRELLERTVEEARNEQFKADKEKASDDDIRKLMIQARDTQVMYYESQYQQAEQIAADPKENHRKITSHHRLIARWLHKRGRYSLLPKWVTETRPRDFVEKPCPKCGASVDLDKQGNPKGFACVKCNYILDPIRAYEAGEIDQENIALKRATREALDAAGLKDVLTLTEERSGSEKKAKKGKGEQATT